MICEHKRESRSAPASTPLPSLGTCLESSWLCAGFPLRRLWAYPEQTISGAAVDKCGVFAAALLHSRLAAAASAPALALALAPALPLPSLPLFHPSATARFSIVFAAILLPAAPLTAASPCPSTHCLILVKGAQKGPTKLAK